MARTKLRCGGKTRKKAIFGAIANAGATLAAAAMQVAATNNAARQQAQAINANAQSTANALAQQNANNNQLQEQLISSNTQLNKENQDVMRDIVLSNQMQAGNENLAYRQMSNRVALKNGGRRKLKDDSFYGGGRPFKVTDGGDAIPLNTDINGYGLYELIGNDHEHYHKTNNGKSKSGVGIKFNNGEVIEGEGNQNTNQGELMYVTPNDAKFISKHSIKGFNPAEAVDNGMNPEEAFARQESIKRRFRIKDNGNQAKCGKRVKAAVGMKKTFGQRLGSFWNNYGGATINTIGNFAGAGLSAIGNGIAGRRLANAYNQAGETLANAYMSRKGIDMNLIKRSDYEAPSVLATVRSANTNINPMLEKIDRSARAEAKEVNRSTLSSAARFNRLTGINDRRYQNYGQQYAYKTNMDEQIKQQNAQSINQVAMSNADRKIQANQAFGNAYLQGLMYNNQLENDNIMGAAQARADALSQSAGIRANSLQSSMQGFANSLASGGQGFGSAFDSIGANRRNILGVLLGADNDVANNPRTIEYLKKYYSINI